MPQIDYQQLIEQFLHEEMSAKEFQAVFIDTFKKEKQLGEPLFAILDELFGDVDSFTDDQKLLAENPNFYLDEARLRQKAKKTIIRLLNLKKNG